MSLSIAQLAKRLFRRAATTSPRMRLNLTALEDRTVPTQVVTIAWMADATEGNATPGKFQLSRTETVGSLEVMVTVSGTATQGEDYQYITSSVTFANGSANADVFVYPIDDSVVESTETVTLHIAPVPNGYTVGTPSFATLNIYDNDTPVVTVEKIADAAEGGGNGLFRFTRTGGTSGTLTVTYTVGGTATGGVDYTAYGIDYTTQTGTITFPGGYAPAASVVELHVTPVDDLIAEPTEVVNLTVQNAFGYLVGSPGSATMSIVDNDTLIWVIDPIPPVFVNENAPDSTIDLIPVFFPSEEVARFEVASSVPGLVMAQLVGSDLVLDYLPNMTGSATVTVTAFDRNEDSVSTSFEVGVYPLTSVTATGLPVVGVGADYELTLDPGTEDAIDWTVDWGDGTSSTVGGGTIPVFAFHQYLTEGDFVVAATANLPQGYAAAKPILVRALDPTKNPDLWTVRSLPLNDVIIEGAAGTTKAIEFRIKPAIPVRQQFQVSYTTLNGSATAGTDYVAKSDTLTFMPGQIDQKVTIIVNGDNEVEPDEEFYLVLKLPTFENQPTYRLTPVGRGFIKNDDFPVGITDAWTSWEGDPAYTFPNISYEVGRWRKAVAGTTTTMTTPKGVPWSSSMAAEGPYLKTTDIEIGKKTTENLTGKFRYTVEYRTQDTAKVPPMPVGSTPLPGNNQHYGNSGVYIFDRYEVLIDDPSKWGVAQNGVIADETRDGDIVSNRNRLLPGGIYGVDMATVTYKNFAKPTGEWNTLVIEFIPGTIDVNDPKKLSTAAWIKVTLNGELVTKGELKAGALNLTGTGSRGNAAIHDPRDKGAIFLQSHWGSQVEFRNPVVEKNAAFQRD